MNLSLSSSYLKTERCFDQDSCFDQRKVKVYIRTVSRKSVKIELPAQITLDHLKEIIWKKFNIQRQNQVVYLKGTCLNYNLLILLQNNWIIHVINLAQVQLAEINVEIKAPTINKRAHSCTKLTFSPKISVKQFLKSYIMPQYEVDADEMLLVESGRILKPSLTFIQQNIQSGTTINLIHSQKDQITPSSFNEPFLPEKTQITTNQVQDFKSESNSVKTIEKNYRKTSNFFKASKKNFCSIHYQKKLSNIDQSQATLSFRDYLKTPIKLLESSSTKNVNTPIGERQCNCKKQKQVKHVKQPKFITIEDKKRLSKQIRQQNLQKLMRTKQKKDQQIYVQPISQKKTLVKVRSLEVLKPNAMTERKTSTKVVRNPQRNSKC